MWKNSSSVSLKTSSVGVPGNHSSTTTLFKLVYAATIEVSFLSIQLCKGIHYCHLFVVKVYAGSDSPLTILDFPTVHSTISMIQPTNCSFSINITQLPVDR